MKHGVGARKHCGERICLGFGIRFLGQAGFQEQESGNGQERLLLEGMKPRLKCLWEFLCLLLDDVFYYRDLPFYRFNRKVLW